MAKGKPFTITTHAQPSPPRPLTPAEVNAIADRHIDMAQGNVTFDPSPAEPLDHERNQPSPTGHIPVGNVTHQKASTTMANASVNPADHPSPAAPAAPKRPAARAQAAQASNGLPSEKEVERLMPNIPANLRNNELVRRKAYYLQEAEKLGAQDAKNALTLINLAEKAVDGAVEGALKPSDKSEDAFDLYSHFAKARGKVAPQTEGTIGTKARQLSWFIKLGHFYKESGKKFFNDMQDLHNAIVRDPAQLKAMKFTAVFEDVNQLVRKQMMKFEDAQSQPIPVIPPLMDEDEARSYVFKENPDPETAVDLLISAFKALEKANEGRKENKAGTIPARAGLKAQDLLDAMQIIQNFTDKLSQAEKTEFFSRTSHKKKKAMAAPSTASAETAGVESSPQEEIPQFEGYNYDYDTGHYVDEEGRHYNYNAETSEMEEALPDEEAVGE